MQNKKIVILGTGGTIAGTATSASDNTGYVAAQLGIDVLVRGLPNKAFAGNVETMQVAQLDSKDMTFEVWVKLARQVNLLMLSDDIAAVVITHGTDTLEETAFFLHAVLAPAKPVVLTCAMRPATALMPDGPQNMLDALAVAGDPAAKGVLVVCAGVIHGPEAVQKIHSYRLDAFGSGDIGPLGYVEQGSPRWAQKRPVAQVLRPLPAINKIAWSAGADWPWVEVVMNLAGTSAAAVHAMVATGVKGLVLAGTGNGTAHQALEAALIEAQAKGVRVVRASRCVYGHVLPATGDALEDSAGLSPAKARVALMLSLMQQRQALQG